MTSRSLITALAPFILFSCSNPEGSPDIKRITPEDSTARYERLAALPWDTLFQDDQVLILGPNMDSSIVTGEREVGSEALKGIYSDEGTDVYASKEQAQEVNVFYKYQPETSFDQFSVEVYTGPLAPPDFNSYPEIRRFITRINTTCASTGVNFGGKYTLVSWGCGSNCSNAVIVNRINGEILNAPFATLGRTFHPNSSMIAINNAFVDTANSRFPRLATGNVEHHALVDKSFELVEEFVK